MLKVLDDKDKRRALIRHMSGESIVMNKHCLDFLGTVFDREFRNYIHPYK